MIAAVTLSVYLPAWSVKTDYDFIYASCVGRVDYYPYNCGAYLKQRYGVEEGRLVVRAVDLKTLETEKRAPAPNDYDYDARIFWHDTAKNESREITLTEAIVSGSFYQHGDLYAYLTMAMGVAYLLLAYAWRTSHNRKLVELLYFFGSAGLLWGRPSRKFSIRRSGKCSSS